MKILKNEWNAVIVTERLLLRKYTLDDPQNIITYVYAITRSKWEVKITVKY